MLKSVLGGLIVLGLLILALWVAKSSASAEVGVKDGKLLPCPDRPNCVSSQDQSDTAHFVEPFPLSSPPEQALGLIREVVASVPRAELVEERPGYLRFVFTSAVLRFDDDVEFLVDEAAGVIQVRSASRLGYSDFGVNRKRVDTIRKRLLH